MKWHRQCAFWLRCASKRYKDSVKPVLDRLSKRYEQYAERIAKMLNCEAKEILPYVYMAITALTNYMIFKEDEIVYQGFAEEKVLKLIEELVHKEKEKC